MKLFGHPDSGHAFKVKFLLAAAGLAHDYEEIDIFAPCDDRPAEFRQHARFQEVPLLIDESRAYVQSNAILVYLAKKTGHWGAQDESTLNRCLEWLFWESNKLGMCLPQLRAANRFDDYVIDDGALQWLTARFKDDVRRLDLELADRRRYVLGNEPTIADFSLCGYLYLADEANVQVPTNVRAWLDRLASLPGWQHPYELLRAPAL